MELLKSLTQPLILTQCIGFSEPIRMRWACHLKVWSNNPLAGCFVLLTESNFGCCWPSTVGHTQLLVSTRVPQACPSPSPTYHPKASIHISLEPFLGLGSLASSSERKLVNIQCFERAYVARSVPSG